MTSIGLAVNVANGSAAAVTDAVTAPGADEVSAAITAVFNTEAQIYQELSARVASFRRDFAAAMNAARIRM